MKKIHLMLCLGVLVLLSSCTKDNDDLSFLETATAPKNISALVTTSQDNTGTVTFLPKGEGVTHYEIYFGDGTALPTVVKAGETTNHVYAQGTYQAKIVGITLNGQKTEVTQEVVVSFGPPTNLVATVTTGANLSVKVSATADSETFFKVYFGTGPNEVPVQFMEGQEISHTYAAKGTYQVKVVALNGGITTIETTKTVVITNLTAAPVPTKSAANVISLFSDTYTNIGVATWHTDWSNATLTDIAISGNNAKEYSALGFVGVEPTAPINATTMTHFHIDVWSADFTAFKIKLVDYGANGVWEQNGDNVEHEITIDAPAKEQWVGIDIPLSNFTGLTTRAHIAQLIFSGTPYAATKVIVDNIYFYKTPSVSESIAMPLDFESNTLTYGWVGFGSSGFGSIPVAVIDNPNKTGINTSNKVVSIEKPAAAQVWAGGSLALTAPIDLTKGTKIKVAVWSPKIGAKILFKTEDTTSPLVNGNPSIFVEKEALTTVANAWEVLTFDIAIAAGYNAANSYRNIVLFPDFSVAGTGTTYYFDNIVQSN